jgi:hypothetical protein
MTPDESFFERNKNGEPYFRSVTPLFLRFYKNQGIVIPVIQSSPVAKERA